MNITRRGFLKGMLALGAAPAICKAENLMKIWVPPQELVLGRGMTKSIFHMDELGMLGGDFDGDSINICSLEHADQAYVSRMCVDSNSLQYKQMEQVINRQIGLAERFRGKSVLVSRNPNLHRAIIMQL